MPLASRSRCAGCSPLPELKTKIGKIFRDNRERLASGKQYKQSCQQFAQKLKKLIDDEKVTVIVRDADAHHPLLARWVSTVSNSFGIKSGISLYYTPAGAVSGVAPHVDTMDVVAVQVSGSKRWTVEPSTKNLPLDEMIPHELTIGSSHRCSRVGECIGYFSGKDHRRHLRRVDYTLSADGTNILYVPRGWIHNTSSALDGEDGERGAERASIHISLGIEPNPRRVVWQLLAWLIRSNAATSTTNGGGIPTIPSFFTTATGDPLAAVKCLNESSVLTVLLHRMATNPRFYHLRRAVVSDVSYGIQVLRIAAQTLLKTFGGADAEDGKYSDRWHALLDDGLASDSAWFDTIHLWYPTDCPLSPEKASEAIGKALRSFVGASHPAKGSFARWSRAALAASLAVFAGDDKNTNSKRLRSELRQWLKETKYADGMDAIGFDFWKYASVKAYDLVDSKQCSAQPQTPSSDIHAEEL